MSFEHKQGLEGFNSMLAYDVLRNAIFLVGEALERTFFDYHLRQATPDGL